MRPTRWAVRIRVGGDTSYLKKEKGRKWSLQNFIADATLFTSKEKAELEAAHAVLMCPELLFGNTDLLPSGPWV